MELPTHSSCCLVQLSLEQAQGREYQRRFIEDRFCLIWLTTHLEAKFEGKSKAPTTHFILAYSPVQ